MAISAYDVQVVLGCDTRQYESGIASAGKSMTRFGDIIKGILGAQIIQKGFQALVNGFRSIVDSGKGFEVAMSQVRATMGSASDEMVEYGGQMMTAFDAISKEAGRLGATTQFTAEQAADGFNVLAMAGMDASTAIEVLAPTLDLAAAGAIDIAQAADFATGIMAGFGIEAEEAGRVADYLTKMSQSAKGSVSDFGTALADTAGMAKTTGQSIESTAVALEILGNHNVSAAEAGTSLTRVLKNLYQPTDAAKKAMEDLGFSAYTAEGEARPLEDVLLDLNIAMDGWSDQAKNEYLSQIFDAATLRTVPFLIDDVTTSWDALAEGLANSGGAAADAAATQLDNLQGAMTLLSSATDGLKIALYNNVQEPLKNLVKGAAEFVSGFTEALQNGGLSEALTYTGDAIRAGLSGAFDSAKNSILEKFPELEGLFTKVSETWSVIETNVQGIVESIKLLISTGLTWVSDFWDKWGVTILSVASSVFDAIKTVIGTAMSAIQNIITIITGLISGDWGTVWEGMKGLVTGVFEGILNVVGNILDVLWTIVGAKISNIVNNAVNDFNQFKSKVSSIFEGIKNAITNPIQTAHDVASKVVSKMKNFFNFSWELPRIKLPHFSVSGSANPINWLTQGVPRISVSWYKKAYDSGYLFKNPTIIPAMGMGEGVGSELLIGESKLHETIGDVVDGRIGNLASAINSVVAYMEEYFPQFANRQMVLDSGALVGQMTPALDASLGTMQARRWRGQ